MSLAAIKECIAALDGLQIRAANRGHLSPYWGLFEPVVGKLEPRVAERIADVVTLFHPGDRPRPEKTVLTLGSADQFEIGGRHVRAIKLKGISPRLLAVGRGEVRHIRLLGRGDIPTLVPYLNPAGEERFVTFDVGEPYCAKKFRSVLNETVIVAEAWRRGCAVAVPLGLGIYEDPALFFKGEPVGFSIWGVEHPEDERFDEQWRARFKADCAGIAHAADAQTRAVILLDSVRWTRRRLSGLLREARRYHAAGFVHHELQFDNHAYCGESLSVLDWEEAAHCTQLSRAQFLESVLIDLYKLVCYCGVLEREYGSAIERHALAREHLDRELLHTNWFIHYFESPGSAIAAKLAALLPMDIRDGAARGAFRSAVYPLIESLYAGLAFGPGLDWVQVARPFEDGFSAAAPRWRPEASTTFDPRLFVKKGNRAPGSDALVQPSAEIADAEKAIHTGCFADAVDIYARLLEADDGDGMHRQYISHNLAALCLALRRDAEAERYFQMAYAD